MRKRYIPATDRLEWLVWADHIKMGDGNLQVCTVRSLRVAAGRTACSIIERVSGLPWVGFRQTGA
ncbi:hypothetical protein P775_21040 [Puniceibacterium antarcticum]|uniref:Uncharacterized protein n=1 Tax=Puniceibacterium antarcticum TaxID=1206336 RepID=A0A2G8R9E6_9RHOB|nr:hypothetical protein P775_21040 [Puniceibacterium antarcticum]